MLIDEETVLQTVDLVFGLPVPAGTPCAQKWRHQTLKNALKALFSIERWAEHNATIQGSKGL